MTPERAPLPLSGYVLAGGRSTRMGTDKACLLFGGTPLIEIAVRKLRPICDTVAILGDRPDLAQYAEIVPDRIPAAGPLGGIDAALHHARQEWILLLPVDLPLLPGEMLHAWARSVLEDAAAPAACCFSVAGMLQPLVSLLHRNLAPFLRASLEAGVYKVTFALEAAASAASTSGSRRGGLRIDSLAPALTPEFALWFANLNAPEDLARALSNPK